MYDTDAGTAEYFCFGGAEGRIPQSFLDFAAEKAVDYRESHGMFGVLYGGLRYLYSYLEEDADGEAERVDESSPMPSWYPADPANFSFYQDEEAPRVVDAADILSDADEERLEARIRELRRELVKDIVIYTDVSTYGLERSVLAADFYDFNGYGCGEGREGVCLFICMDPADRDWWVCCTGPVTMELYTESAANLLDDALYDYMAAGDYAAGVSDWVENIRTLYRKGIPFAPDWYPDQGTEFARFHDAAAPRVPRPPLRGVLGPDLPAEPGGGFALRRGGTRRGKAEDGVAPPAGERRPLYRVERLADPKRREAVPLHHLLPAL